MEGGPQLKNLGERREGFGSSRVESSRRDTKYSRARSRPVVTTVPLVIRLPVDFCWGLGRPFFGQGIGKSSVSRLGHRIGFTLDSIFPISTERFTGQSCSYAIALLRTLLVAPTPRDREINASALDIIGTPVPHSDQTSVLCYSPPPPHNPPDGHSPSQPVKWAVPTLVCWTAS